MKLQLAYVVACLAAGASFLLNRILLGRIGVQVIITLSPVLEEMLKTLSSYFFSADILITHLVFGLIEAAYDWIQTRGQVFAAFLSIAGHGLFGGVTVFTAQLAGIYVGLSAGIIIHLIWNTVMIRLHIQR